MMKRLLTFALSVGFFIWLPNAFADGGDILSLDAPSHIRQTQTPGDDNALLTLRVDNIQVRAGWEVTDAAKVFTINAGMSPNEGVLRTTVNATDTHVATIYAVDRFELLNPSYANLTASAVITVKFESGELELSDAPRLTAVAGKAANLHTFAAQGGIGARTYTLVAGNAEGHFSLGVESGVLSLLASAPVAIYTLSVQVRDAENNKADALAVVDVRELFLANAGPLYAIEGRAVSLHTFEAQGGTGAGIYTLVAGDERYFTLGMNSGVLSVLATAPIGIYTLTVQVDDEDKQADTTAIVEVRASLSLATVPPLTVVVGKVAHTLAASNGIGTYTYAIVSGDEVGFALDAVSGVLSLSVNAELGRHTLMMQVKDERGNTVQALATVEVSAALVLADAPPFTVIASVAMSLHMFIASGGIGTLSYAILAGNEKEGFTLNATSGVLSVVNAAAGVYTLSVKVSDSRGNSAQARGTVQVLAFLSLADAPSLETLARLSLTVALHTFAASGGVGSKRYTLIAGETSYFALDAASGELSLPSNSAMLAGAYTLRVEVSDSLTPPQRATAAATVQIARNGIFVLGGNFHNDTKNDVWRSTDGKAWKRETANAGWPGRSDYQAAVHQGRMYVLGGWAGSSLGRRNDVWWSADGKNWSFEGNAAWSARDQHQVVAYQGRLYVLGGTDGTRQNDVWSWAEGEESWTEETGAAAWSARQGHQAVVHNGRMYVLGGNDGSHKKDVWSSADGANWRFEGNAEWRAREYHLAVSHQGRLYILGGSWGDPDLSDVWSSLDGKSWRQELANNGSFWSHRYGFGALSRDGLLYVLGGQNGPYLNDVWSSVDGKSWKEETAAAAWRKRQLQAVVFPPNLVLSGTSETIILPLLQGGAAVAGHTVSAQYGGGQYTYSLTPEIAAINIDGAGVLSADNQAQAGAYKITVRVEDEEGGHAETIINIELRTFALADAPPLFALARLSVAARLHAFTAAYGDGAYTYDLVNNAGDFIIGEASGVLSVQANAAVGVYTVSVAVSDAGDNRATAVATVRIAKNGIFVLGGEDTNYHNDVWVSAEGRNWIKVADAPWSARTRHQMVVYQGRMYVLGGWQGTSSSDGNSLNDVWSSADGKNWRPEADAPWSARNAHQLVAYNGRMYVLGGATGFESGFLNDVWSWAKGESWTEEAAADWSARSEHQAVSHNSRLYVLGGWDNDDAPRNDVWSSVDGENWQQEKANNTDNSVDWTRRRSHQAMLHNGRIYVMGGWGYNPTYNGVGGQGVLNDVWSSTDVENWDEKKQDTNSSGWFFRNFFQAVSHDGQIYVLGGDYRGDRSNDVWRSVEGSTWEKVADADWSVRSAHQAVVFPPNLALSGIGETITLTAGVETEIYTFSAQYGFGQYTYSLAPENIDIKIGSDGVLLMDDQAQTGAYAITVRVEDKEGSHAETIINIEIRSFALADAPPLFVFAGLSESVSLHAFTAIYGVGAYTYTLVGDDVGYFTLGTASGVLSVTANVSVGVYTLSVGVSDERAKTAAAVATVAVVPILSLADAPLRSVVAGKAVSLHTFTAVGGSRTKTYNLVNAPGFFALGESSGILSVQVVSEAGIYTVSVQVSDESGQAAAVAIVEVVARLSLADASLIAVEKKAVSLHTFAASGGIGARTYTLLAGNETGYFVLDASGGVLSLSASASAGAYALTVGVKDERGNVATAVAAVNISAALSLADAPPLGAAEGEARNLHTFAASGGIGVKTYTLVAGAAYFTVGVASGVLSVDANAPVAIYTLSVQAADADGVTAVALATVEVVSLLLLDAPMLYAIVGQEVSLHTFDADGGSGAKVFTIVDGNEDMYFTLVASSGVLSVQANASVGIYTLAVAVDDEDGNQSEGLAVVAVEASLFLADTPSLVAFTEITMSLYTFAASGGIGAKTYTLSAVDGQEYFTLNATSGVLSAANAALGVYTLSVQVSDSRGNSAQARGTVEVFEFLSLADAPSLEVFARLSLTVALHTFAASGGYEAKRYTLIADQSGYFALDADSGVLSLPSNSAMLAGAYTLRVEVSDSLTPPQRATAAATVQIARNRIFMLGGNDGGLRNDVWSSVDGESWRQDKANTNNNANVGWTRRQLHQAVAHNGRLYVMGGADGSKRKDVWSSVDGANWQRETDAAWTGREIYQAVSYKGRIYVLGGLDGSKRNDVWSSADGENWEEETGSANWTARDRHQAVVHNGRIWLLGGQDSGGGRNDVWSSANGSIWRFEGNADWDARYFHQAVSHAGRLYVLGGSDGSVKSDVWSSVDGRSWVREKVDNDDFWSKRYRHQSLSRDGLLYVIGGQGSGGRKKDVWSSADGRSWTKRTDAAWSARMFHQALVFPPNLVLSGTSETITLTVGVAAELHTLSAQYGGGQYTYSLALEFESIGFDIDESSGVLSADNAAVGGYTLTVWVEDEEGSRAETVVQVEIIAASTAALSAMERFAWSESGGSRRDVGLSEHGDSGRREELRHFQQAIRYQGDVLDGG